MHDDADRPRAYLFTWNPRKWHWEDLATAAVTVEQRGRLAEDWSCGRTERIKPGDRFFLLKQGADLPRGLMGSGLVTSAVYIRKHWGQEGKQSRYVDIEFDALLDPQRHDLLERHRLDEPPLDKVHWNTQSSGIGIADEVVPVLEERWRAHLSDIVYRGSGASPNAGALDRNTAAGARAVLERILPDPVRRTAVLGAFADAIEQVHQTAPALWSVTLHQDRCRLIIGRGVGCTIKAGALWMQLARDGLTTRDKEALDRSSEWRWSDSDEGLKTDQLVHGHFASDDPESSIWPVIFRQNVRAMDYLVSHSRVIHAASAPAYSPGVIAYLNEELRRPLPSPSWAAAHVADV